MRTPAPFLRTTFLRISSGGVRAALTLSFTLASIHSAHAASRPNEIVISAADSAETSTKVLSEMFRKSADLNEAPPPSTTARPVRYYQFLPARHCPAKSISPTTPAT